MERSKLSRARAIGRYRRHIRDLTLISFVAPKRSMRFSPFVSRLIEYADGGRDWIVEEWNECLRHEDCKDRAVEEIRDLAKNVQDETTIAVWFATTGWSAPHDDVRPSQHPQRRHVILVFESTLDGDRLFQHDGSKWHQSVGGLSGRFNDLIGREKHRKHLRVVPACKG